MVDRFASSGSFAQSEPRICALCTTPAQYRCPRCAAPTCSLACSRKHKRDTKCTGERDKVQYVPMNAYCWGTMMQDYCYLEDVGRKVSEWGSGIVKGGYIAAGNNAASTPKHPSRRKSTPGKSKRDLLMAHLETLGIDVELLPAGMERRTLNQSTFDQSSKRPLLTIEFVFYPPTTASAISSAQIQSYKTLTHRNSLSAILLALLQRQASPTPSRSQKQKENVPDWLPSIVTPHPEAHEHFISPHCYVRANPEFPHAPNAAYYHKLEPTLSLCELLQRTSFIEFPTIHVFDPEASSFRGTVVDKSGSIVRALEGDQVNVARAAKWKKLDKTVGQRTVFGLVGGYGSEGSSRSGDEAANKHLNGLANLGAYSESDEEASSTSAEVEEDQTLHSDDDPTQEEDRLDPVRLLEFVEQARGAADEDILDWGDEWDVGAVEQNV